MSFFYQKEEEEETKPRIILSALQEQFLETKIKDFYASKRQKCIEEILADAEAFVDSIIINEINIKVMDTIVFPDRPFKPQYPTEIILDDSTKIQPIFDAKGQ